MTFWEGATLGGRCFLLTLAHEAGGSSFLDSVSPEQAWALEPVGLEAPEITQGHWPSWAWGSGVLGAAWAPVSLSVKEGDYSLPSQSKQFSRSLKRFMME